MASINRLCRSGRPNRLRVQWFPSNRLCRPGRPNRLRVQWLPSTACVVPVVQIEFEAIQTTAIVPVVSIVPAMFPYDRPSCFNLVARAFPFFKGKALVTRLQSLGSNLKRAIETTGARKRETRTRLDRSFETLKITKCGSDFRSFN